MKRFLILCAILLALSAGQAFAQLSISVDSVGNILGSPADSVVKAGDTVKFYMRYTNHSDTGWNLTNAFVISSPDGATWTDSAAGNFRGSNLGPIGIDTTGLLSKALFPTVYAIRTFSSAGTIAKADGISPDTVAFSGAASAEGEGLTPQTDVRNFVIRIRTKLADVGKHVCIDSTAKFPPTNVWKWALLYGGNPGGVGFPAWSGRACFRIDTVSTVDVNITPGDGLPKEFSLKQNYPNPFNPTTQINFELPERANVSLKIYNLLGQEVAQLANGEFAAGRYYVDWNATGVASGVYFYKIEAGNFVQTKKMVVMK